MIATKVDFNRKVYSSVYVVKNDKTDEILGEVLTSYVSKPIQEILSNLRFADFYRVNNDYPHVYCSGKCVSEEEVFARSSSTRASKSPNVSKTVLRNHMKEYPKVILECSDDFLDIFDPFSTYIGWKNRFLAQRLSLKHLNYAHHNRNVIPKWSKILNAFEKNRLVNSPDLLVKDLDERIFNRSNDRYALNKEMVLQGIPVGEDYLDTILELSVSQVHELSGYGKKAISKEMFDEIISKITTKTKFVVDLEESYWKIMAKLSAQKKKINLTKIYSLLAFYQKETEFDLLESCFAEYIANSPNEIDAREIDTFVEIIEKSDYWCNSLRSVELVVETIVNTFGQEQTYRIVKEVFLYRPKLSAEQWFVFVNNKEYHGIPVEWWLPLIKN